MYENKTHRDLQMNVQLLYRKKIENKWSGNNLFIIKTLIVATLLQQGVPKEWLIFSNNIERAEMMMTKVQAIKRTKNQRAELVQLYREDKEWNALPKDDHTVNVEDDDKGYESDNCDEL